MYIIVARYKNIDEWKPLALVAECSLNAVVGQFILELPSGTQVSVYDLEYRYECTVTSAIVNDDDKSEPYAVAYLMGNIDKSQQLIEWEFRSLATDCIGYSSGCEPQRGQVMLEIDCIDNTIRYSTIHAEDDKYYFGLDEVVATGDVVKIINALNDKSIEYKKERERYIQFQKDMMGLLEDARTESRIDQESYQRYAKYINEKSSHILISGDD